LGRRGGIQPLGSRDLTAGVQAVAGRSWVSWQMAAVMELAVPRMERPVTPWGFLSSAAIRLQVSCSRTVGSKLEPVSADLFPKSVNGTACSLS
jgi:hypothetical protein